MRGAYFERLFVGGGEHFIISPELGNSKKEKTWKYGITCLRTQMNNNELLAYKSVMFEAGNFWI